MITQEQQFYKSHNRTAQINDIFMELVIDHNLTSHELEKLIEKRPEIYGQFSHWVETLKKKEETGN